MIDRDVFLSLLSLDAYNRGLGANIDRLGVEPNVSRIGDATLITDSDRTIGSAGVDAGFYAVAYNWNGETIISYRGTNFDPGDSITEFLSSPLVQDIWNGWSLGAGFEVGPGFGPSSQAALAIDFYEAVTGRDVYDPVSSAATATLTGHSLGGGLAASNDNLAMEDEA